MISTRLAYWTFKSKATNEHGVHSPFLFALVTFCFYNKHWKSIRKTPWEKEQQKKMGKAIFKQLEQFIEKAVIEFQIEALHINYQNEKKLSDWIVDFAQETKPHITLIDNLNDQRDAWNPFTTTTSLIT